MQSEYLNPRVFDLNGPREYMRQGFGDGLLEAAEKNKDIVVLCADLKESTRVETFAQKYPERFVEIGVSEQNLASVASGMAAGGKIPFITSYAIFSPGRNWEQIRTTICYNNVAVKIIGSHAGVSVGPDGGSHQALEDIALMRVLPRMNVIVPCDAHEAKKATLAIAKSDLTYYLRLARNKTPLITTEEAPFKIGKANLLVEAEKPVVAIIACGPLVHGALLAAKKLKKEGIEVSILNNHTIKPMDEKSVIALAKKAGAVVTVEEHQVAGGMGSAVAEVLAKNCSVPMEFIGVQNMFGQSGNPAELLAHYEMSVDDIIAAAKKVIPRKKYG